MKQNPSIEEVIESVKELYVWSFKKAREIDRDKADHYEVGKIDGINDACSAMLLKLIGGKELFTLWASQLEEGE